MSTKRNLARLPSVKSPADKNLYVKRVREVFAEVTPRPVVRSDETGLLTLLVAGEAVAQIGREGFRTLPDGPWQSWRIHRPEACDAMREAVADIISARDLSNPDRSASAAIWKPEHRPVPAPGGDRDQPGVDRATEPEQVRDALIARGVDAKLVDDAVVVRHVGRVNVEPGNLAKVQARRFVREQTLPYLTEIERRIRAQLSNNDRVEIAVVKDVIRVTADGNAVATINRFQISGMKGFPNEKGDLLHDPSMLTSLAKAVDAATTRRARVAAEPSASTNAKLKATPVDEVPAGFLRADTILRSWPAGLSPSAARRGQQASDRLRADRRLDLAMHVEVVTDHGLVSFEPLKVGQNPLEARFTFRRAGRVVDAALRLKTPSGPLALRLAAQCPNQLVGEAWAAAVAVYAELTCVEPAPVPTADPSRRRLQRAAISQGHTSPAQHRPLATAGRSSRPVTLVVASLAQAHDALRAVSGHLRRLTADQSSSADAQKAAESVGITVPSGFTWVKAHRRGEGHVRIDAVTLRTLW